MPHEYNHDSIHFLKSLAEAGQAMEELPRVRAELASIADRLDGTEHRLEAERSAKELLQGTVEALKAEIAAKEAELAQAKFREGELNAVVDLIRGVLPNASAGPSADPVAESVSNTGGAIDQGSSAVDPIASQTQPLESQSVNSAETGDTVKTQDTDRPLPPPSASDSDNSYAREPSTPAGSQAGTDSLTDSLTKEDREPLGEADSVGFATQQTDTVRSARTDSVGVTSTDKPYLGWGSHRKPQNLTWGDYERLGGYRPYWCNPDLT